MSRPIDLRAVQEVVAARGHYRCTRAMVITNSSFTKAAIELALDNDVILWGQKQAWKRNSADTTSPRLVEHYKAHASDL
ncbi:MAG: restriction endonuclease [Bacillota bacterium]